MTSSCLQIAIDASRTTSARVTGTEQYALELLRHLIALNDQRDRPHRLILYFRDAPPADLLPQSPAVEQIVVPLARLWTHARFAAALWRTRPDVTFVPAHTLPFAFPGRAVVTVHDVGYRHFPQAHPFGQRLYLDLTTRYSARRATRVLVDSQATADDLHRFYGTPRDKMRVVYPGVTPPESTGLLDGGIARVRERYQLPPHYFLFLGTLQPRKNIERIVAAFAQWKRAQQDSSTALVLAGGRGWLFDEAWVQGVPDVILTGYIDEADKAPLLAGALALVFPSLHEGFGFPAVEAMHAGTPVIASSTSSLPELVGDAGILVDPLNVNEIAAALDLIAWHDGLRRQIRLKGYRQAEQFTWQNAARDALRVLEEAAGAAD